MPPPAGKTRQFRALAMPAVHKTAGQAARTAVEVFISAPHRKIHLPVVQRQGDVAGTMGKIETHGTSGGVSGAGDPGHIEHLTAVIIYPAQQHQGDRCALFRQHRLDVLAAMGGFSRAQGQLQQGLGRIIAVKTQLRLHRVLIGGEGIGFNQNFMAFFGGTIEGDHHQVEVDGQAVHDDHFLR